MIKNADKADEIVDGIQDSKKIIDDIKAPELPKTKTPEIETKPKADDLAPEAVEDGVKKASKSLTNPSDLQLTHGQTLSNRQMNKLVDEIKKNGIQETIKYVEVDGIKYVVDGHHRLIAAKKLGIKEVPIEQVELPYLGYKTVEDLFWSDY